MTFYPRSIQISNTPTLYEAKSGGVFSKDERYRKRSAYSHHTIKTDAGGLNASSVDAYMEPSQNIKNAVAAKAYDRFLDKMRGGASASLGASIAEGRSSLEMIASRAIMLRNAWKAVRRGDVVGAAKHLGIPPTSKRIPKPRGRQGPGKVSKKHYASATWLELHFGWAPLLGDIHDACEVLSKPIFGSAKVVASASDAYTRKNAGFPDGEASGKYGVRYEGEIQVSNPNLFLASRMGLVNPAAIAWELVPFSFVVDWFTNVGQFLSSLTDFAGTTWLGGSSSTKLTASGWYMWDGRRRAMSRDHQVRTLLSAPPTPRLFVQSPLGGPARAATQIALLIQLFIKP